MYIDSLVYNFWRGLFLSFFRKDFYCLVTVVPIFPSLLSPVLPTTPLPHSKLLPCLPPLSLSMGPLYLFFNLTLLLLSPLCPSPSSHCQLFTSFFFLEFFKNILFIFRYRGREGEREGETHQCVVASHTPPIRDLVHNPGILTGDPTGNPLVCRLMLNPLSHTSQGSVCSVFPHLRFYFACLFVLLIRFHL